VFTPCRKLVIVVRNKRFVCTWTLKRSLALTTIKMIYYLEQDTFIVMYYLS
jgi:hypothetical protein